MVYISYTKLPPHLPCPHFNDYLNKIPSSLQQKTLKYLQWQDKYAHLFGKILLADMLMLLGFGSDCLNSLCYNKYGRPFIPGNVDFNISHSKDYVICAISKDIRLGIDVQIVESLDLSNFGNVMSKEQWEVINRTPDKLKAFFNYWAMKESIIKADGRGLSIPLIEINIMNDTVFYHGNTWYLKGLNIDTNYCFYLATNKKDYQLNINNKQYW